MTARVLSLLLLVAPACGGRPIPGAPPEGALQPATPPPAMPGGAPPAFSSCDAPSQLVAASAALDGAYTTLREVKGSVGRADSPYFSNHIVNVSFEFEGEPEVEVSLALDRVLAVGEELVFDAGAPGTRDINVAIEAGDDNGISIMKGDTFSGWARVGHLAAQEFAVSFCLLAWRGSASKASFSWARANLPEMKLRGSW